MSGHLHPSIGNHKPPTRYNVFLRRRGPALAPIARAQRPDPLKWVERLFSDRGSTKANAAQPGSAARRGLFSSDIDESSVLAIENIRDQLTPQSSPFVETNYSGGGCAQYLLARSFPSNLAYHCNGVSLLLIGDSKHWQSICTSSNHSNFCSTHRAKGSPGR